MAEYIERRQAIKLVYDARRSPPIKGVFTDTMSWAIAAVNDITAADVQPVRWIPVAERLPNIYETVLLCGKEKYNFEEEYRVFVDLGFLKNPEADSDREKWATDNDWYEGEQEYMITHWMQLPEPPKEGET